MTIGFLGGVLVGACVAGLVCILILAPRSESFESSRHRPDTTEDYSDYMNGKTGPHKILEVAVLDENGNEETMPFNGNPENWLSPCEYTRSVIGERLIYQKKKANQTLK